MIRKLLTTLTGALLALSLGAAGAYFTAQLQVPDSVIRGGTVAISAEPTSAPLSIDSLAPYGLMVSFGNASGPVPPMPLTALKGTLYVTRPSLMPHTEKRENLLEIAGDLMKMVSSGKVKIEIDQRYPLAEAVQAHRDLEARKTTGSTVLLP